MNRKIPYRIILPENHDNSEQKYPVLYLLHGLFGSCENWLELTDVESYSAAENLIIVMPEGGNNWYCDSVADRYRKFESYVIEDLMPEIENKFNVSSSRENRAIAGLSMGGYGALKYGLKRPDLFCFTASMSGAFDAPNLSESNKSFAWEILKSSISEVFGQADSDLRKANDLFTLIESLPENLVSSLPELYIECGKQDGFLETNRKLVDALRNRNIFAEYREFSGGHDWHYWNQGLARIIKIVCEKIVSQNNLVF